MKKLVILSIIMVSAASCNNWLDINPKMEINKYDMYESEDGFISSLAGCYIKLKSQDLYGKSLTMTSLEYLVQHWEVEANTLGYYLSEYDFGDESVVNHFDKIYEKLYNIIIQLNEIIEYAEKNKHVFSSERMADMVMAEALAMRGFCHLDLLRLYGPVPQLAAAGDNIGLAYMTRVTKDVVQRDTWGSYTTQLESDLNRSSELLAQTDPVIKYSFDATADPSQFFDGEFFMYRQFRFNYYAVEGLKARYYLYVGDRESALTASRTVIGDLSDTKRKLTLSSHKDIVSERYVSPKEHLLSLSIFDLGDYTENLFEGRAPLNKDKERLTVDLYENSVTDVRLLNLWGDKTIESGTVYNVLKKYQQQSNTSSKIVSLIDQMVPLLKLSEVYLIAMECAPISEANRYADEYFKSRDISHAPFSTDVDRMNTILKEYNKDFYAEGQLFYTYKRLFETRILWYNHTMTKDNYVIPMPLSDRLN